MVGRKIKINSIESRNRANSKVSSSINKTRKENKPVNEFGENSNDTMADTCVLGKNWSIIRYNHQTCDVFPFNNDNKPTQNIEIVTGAIMIQHSQTG